VLYILGMADLGPALARTEGVVLVPPGMPRNTLGPAVIWRWPWAAPGSSPPCRRDRG